MNLAINLPRLTFHLPEWQEKQFQPYQQAAQKLKKIAKEGGKNSNRFQRICYALLNQRDSFSRSLLKEAIDVRAFTLVLNVAEFCQAVSLTPSLLQHLLTIRSPLSKLSLMQLISAYFEQYNNLTKSVESHRYLGEFITAQLQQHFKAKTILPTNDLALFYKYHQLLFADNAPEQVVDYAKKKNSDLAEIFVKLGLNGYRNGEFCKQANYIYYLETLNTLPVGKPDPILNEICQESVYEARYQKRKLGHRILEILIDRSQKESGELTQAWQDVIMQIAGDPRVPKSMNSFQTWWSLLGEKRIEQMQIWLNKFNLKLFLKILEQSAVDQQNEDMQRMFASRKNFIIGLDNQKMIRNSRLFLTDSARRYIFQHYQRNKLPSFASVSGISSIIYLQLTNGQHIIEGSHSFKIKLFDQLPEHLRILDYGKLTYDDWWFRSNLEQYARFYKQHDVHLNWLNDISKQLIDSGLDLDMSQILNKEDYHYFIRRFGVY